MGKSGAFHGFFSYVGKSRIIKTPINQSGLDVCVVIESMFFTSDLNRISMDYIDLKKLLQGMEVRK